MMTCYFCKKQYSKTVTERLNSKSNVTVCQDCRKKIADKKNSKENDIEAIYAYSQTARTRGVSR